MTTTVQTERITSESQGIHVSEKISKRPLEPMDRISEIWFGLIMVLTFTCSLSVTGAVRQEVRTMLIGAIGCNVAWGILDGFMYLLGCFVERGRNISALRAVRSSSDSGIARRLIADAIPPVLASVISLVELEEMRKKMHQLPEPPSRPRLSQEDWLAGGAVFLCVFLSTFPVVIPFLFMHNVRRALRISNCVAVLMLFATGYAFGRYADYRPWRMGLCMAIVGSALVSLTIALGG